MRVGLIGAVAGGVHCSVLSKRLSIVFSLTELLRVFTFTPIPVKQVQKCLV